jgi:hypothetical protein
MSWLWFGNSSSRTEALLDWINMPVGASHLCIGGLFPVAGAIRACSLSESNSSPKSSGAGLFLFERGRGILMASCPLSSAG